MKKNRRKEKERVNATKEKANAGLERPLDRFKGQTANVFFFSGLSHLSFSCLLLNFFTIWRKLLIINFHNFYKAFSPP